MGICGLTKLLRRHAPNCLRHIDNLREAICGRHCIIDTAIYMHMFNYKTDLATCIDRLVEMSDHIKILGGHPLFVFDGANVPEKGGTQRARKAQREKTMEDTLADIALLERVKFDTTLSLIDWLNQKAEIIERLQHKCVCVGFEEYVPVTAPSRLNFAEIQARFNDHNIPWITAETEAERDCAIIAKYILSRAIIAKHILGTQIIMPIVMTQDMDAITFGAPLVMRDLSLTDLKKASCKTSAHKAKSFFIQTRALLNELGMNLAMFTDLCILMGCDFTGHFCGPETALKHIRNHRSIENMELKGHDFINVDYKSARAIFKEPEKMRTVMVKWNGSDITLDDYLDMKHK